MRCVRALAVAVDRESSTATASWRRSCATRAGAAPSWCWRRRSSGGAVDRDGIALRIGGQRAATVRCRTVVNAAGLFAQQVAAHAGRVSGRAPSRPCHFAKGHYFVLSGRSPFRRLVYPMAVAGGLGVHVTLDLAGRRALRSRRLLDRRRRLQLRRSRAPRVLRGHPPLLAGAARRRAAAGLHGHPPQAGAGRARRRTTS